MRFRASTEEWQIRVVLAAAYRLVDHDGWTDLIFTHLSAQVPGPERHFLIIPYGLMFDEASASRIRRINLPFVGLQREVSPDRPEHLRSAGHAGSLFAA